MISIVFWEVSGEVVLRVVDDQFEKLMLIFDTTDLEQ